MPARIARSAGPATACSQLDAHASRLEGVHALATAEQHLSKTFNTALRLTLDYIYQRIGHRVTFHRSPDA
jgi:hypothetical protein